jgi:hypothetical protein
LFKEMTDTEAKAAGIKAAKTMLLARFGLHWPSLKATSEIDRVPGTDGFLLLSQRLGGGKRASTWFRWSR